MPLSLLTELTARQCWLFVDYAVVCWVCAWVLFKLRAAGVRLIRSECFVALAPLQLLVELSWLVLYPESERSRK